VPRADDSEARSESSSREVGHASFQHWWRSAVRAAGQILHREESGLIGQHELILISLRKELHFRFLPSILSGPRT
jgi:hypothetical protein